MTRLAALAVALAAAGASAADQQQPELLVSGDVSYGGFGGPELRATSLRGEAALFVGGRGGWIINHSMVLGGAGYGLVTNVAAPDAVQPVSGRYDMTFGYGGVFIEGIVLPQRLWHLSVSSLFGAGGITYAAHETHAATGYAEDTVFVWEPSAALELNVVSFMRIDLGAGWRLVRGVDLAGLRNSDLTGFSGLLTFKFGKF